MAAAAPTAQKKGKGSRGKRIIYGFLLFFFFFFAVPTACGISLVIAAT